VVVGVGRFTQRPAPVEDCVTPVGMFVEAARRAAADVCVPRASASYAADVCVPRASAS
jgi:hypothetical protein